MQDSVSIRHAALSAVLFSGLGAATALAHGPNIVLTDVGGQIVINQLDVTPLQDSAGTYPVGGAANVFPSEYNVSDYNSWNTSNPTIAANQPTDMNVFPMTYVNDGTGDKTYNSGFYSQIEATDDNGTSTLGIGPGYAYGLGGFAGNTIFQFTFAHTLQYFNASTGTFTATPDGEQLQAIRSSSNTPGTGFANTLTTNGVQSGTGLEQTVSTSQNAGSHNQFEYRLLESNGSSVDGSYTSETEPTPNEIADGIYLATFQVGTADGAPGDATSPVQLETSTPYYLLFELDRPGDTSVIGEEAAAVAAADNLAAIPEPASLSTLAIAGCALLGRRRHRPVC